MMFRKTNEEINLDGLDDFIEKPSQDFKEEKELKKGVDKVIVVLDKNPSAIMNIIKDHPYIPGSFLLDNLADKMKMQGCLNKLGLLFGVLWRNRQKWPVYFLAVVWLRARGASKIHS